MNQPQVERPPLRRSRSECYVAGVAGGLGRWLGVDPAVVRVAFVVLTVIGGSGLVIYAAGWLLLPGEAEGGGETAPIARRWLAATDGRPAVRALLLVAAVIAALSALGEHGSFTSLVALLLIGAGAVLVFVDRDAPRAAAPAAPAAPLHGPAGPPPPPPTPAPAAYQAAPAPPYTVTPYTMASARQPALRAPRPRPFLGPLACALAALAGGALLTGRAAGWVEAPAAAVAAAPLLVLGLALLAAAVWGRARGVIPLGVLLAAVVWAASLPGLPAAEAGEVTRTLDTLDQPVLELRHGVGEITVDLRGVRLAEGERTVRVRLGVGHAVVLTPAGSTVTAVGRTTFGATSLLGEESSGYRVRAERQRRGEGGRLRVEVEVGMGEGEVR